MCVYKIDEIAERVRPVAERYGITKVYLFGSYARGDATEESDVDLMISYRKLTGAFALGGVYADFKEALDKPVDVVSERAISSDYTSDLGRRLYSSIEKEGVLIYAEE